jgi:hypothetical protein
VKTVELVDKKVNTPTQSWMSRAGRRHLPTIDYYSELRSWLQRAMIEAEKKKDFNKKDQLLSLLRDL